MKWGLHLQSGTNRWAFDFVTIPHLVPSRQEDTLGEDAGTSVT